MNSKTKRQQYPMKMFPSSSDDGKSSEAADDSNVGESSEEMNDPNEEADR